MSDLFGPFYKAGRFLVRGYVICDREDFKPALGDLSLHLEGTFRSPLVISRVSGETQTGPSFSFNILTQSVLEQLLSSHDALEEKRFEIRAIDLGRVQHVVGRDGEDFLGRGSTSQLITSISGFGRFGGPGLRLELSGDLSERGFLGEATEPSLVRRTYRTAVEIPWEILRFCSTLLRLRFGTNDLGTASIGPIGSFLDMSELENGPRCFYRRFGVQITRTGPA